jgi:uncharacterized protein YggE
MAPASEALDTTRITVIGSHSVQVPADRGRIQVAVETQGPSAAAAAAANAEAMNRVLEAVRPEAGPGGQVETSGFQLTPRYRQSPDRDAPQEIAGYRAINQLSVTVEEVDRVPRVLDAGLSAGANRITGLSFYASDTEGARLEAVRQATERARREAMAVAEALGLRIAAAETVNTTTSRPAPRWEMASLAAEGAALMDTPVEAGSQAVSASVTITFILLAREAR